MQTSVSAKSRSPRNKRLLIIRDQQQAQGGNAGDQQDRNTRPEPDRRKCAAQVHRAAAGSAFVVPDARHEELELSPEGLFAG